MGPESHKKNHNYTGQKQKQEARNIGVFFKFSEVLSDRKGAKTAFAENEQRFRALTEHASDGVVIYGSSGRIEYTSPATSRILGYSEGEILQSDPIHITHPDDLPSLLPMLNELRQTPGSTITTEYRMRHKDGSWRWIESNVSNFSEIAGIDGLVFNFRDITERKQAEETLRVSENRFRLATKATNDVIWEWNAKTHKLLWTENAQVVFGYLPEEVGPEEKWWDEHIHPDDRERIVSKMDALIAGNESNWVDEYRFRRRDGSYAYISDRGYIERDASGEAIRMVGAMSDIIKRKQAEEEIKRRSDDLLLINTLNEAANRGEDIEDIIEVFSRETRRVFDCLAVAVYLLSPDAKYLEMQSYTIPRNLIDKIEKLIGRPIPKVRVPLKEGSLLEEILANEEGTILNDPRVIQQWIREFSETTFLPPAIQPVIRKVVPQIQKILNIGSAISVPLISSGRAIGIMDMSSRGQFTEDDLQRIRNISSQMIAVLMRKQVEKQVQLQLQRLRALSEIDHAITSSLDMRLSLGILLNEVLSQLGVDAASVLLLNDSSLTLGYIAGKGFRTLAVRQSRLRLGEGLAGQVGFERKTLHIQNLSVEGNQFTRAELFKNEEFQEYFGVPLVAKGQLKGVLEVFHRSPLNPDIEWVNYLETLGGQAAIAIDNAQLFENMQKSNLELIAAYDATIAGWSRAMDLRDRETEGHTQRVTELTLKMAEKMGISQNEQVQIRRGALLHDIGKLGVPDHILLKPGTLSEEEWAIMRQHPIHAFEMLSSIAYLRPALDIPYCHHEKWDGSGYPRGLQGEQIPLVARIFAIVDVWDALTSDRPYRKAWSTENVLEYIKEQSGHHFDPEVVDVFLQAIVSV
jgi:PAS domain S-box-containing protein/putative nucleotidyltransferase with HDIG domain